MQIAVLIKSQLDNKILNAIFEFLRQLLQGAYVVLIFVKIAMLISLRYSTSLKYYQFWFQVHFPLRCGQNTLVCTQAYFENCLAWETKKLVFCTRQVVQFWLYEKVTSKKKKKKKKEKKKQNKTKPFFNPFTYVNSYERDFICFTAFHGKDVRGVGDVICLAGERENQCPGGRLPLDEGELIVLCSVLKHLSLVTSHKYQLDP